MNSAQSKSAAPLLDVLTLVSSDKRFPLDLTQLMSSGAVRLVHTFRTGSECLRSLSLEDRAATRVVIIDKLVSDISPANLCDALRASYPSLSVILVCEADEVEGVQRAMLAGAKATISRSAGVGELQRTLEHLMDAAVHSSGQQPVFSPATSGQRGATSHHGHYVDAAQHRGVVVPIMGARGGAGRSVLSSSLAYLAAQAQIDVALIDFDLQFGDLGFLFGSESPDLSDFLEDVASPSSGSAGFPDANQLGLAAADNLHKYGKQISSHLRLYAPRPVPEKTQTMAQLLPAALDRLCLQHELLIINTGAYWTLFHAELLEHSDLAVCLFDQSIVGIRATTLFRDLCKRTGIPASRLISVMNRATTTGLCPAEVAQVLQVEKVFRIQDAGPELTALFDSGDLSGLDAQATFMSELLEILTELAVHSDLVIHDTLSMRYAMRREGGNRLNRDTNKGKSGMNASPFARKGLFGRA